MPSDIRALSYHECYSQGVRLDLHDLDSCGVCALFRGDAR
jgi:hypothetical protein